MDFCFLLWHCSWKYNSNAITVSYPDNVHPSFCFHTFICSYFLTLHFDSYSMLTSPYISMDDFFISSHTTNPWCSVISHVCSKHNNVTPLFSTCSFPSENVIFVVEENLESLQILDSLNSHITDGLVAVQCTSVGCSFPQELQVCGPSSQPAAGDHSSTDIQKEFNALKDFLSEIRHLSEPKLNKSWQGIKRLDQPIVSILSTFWSHYGSTRSLLTTEPLLPAKEPDIIS